MRTPDHPLRDAKPANDVNLYPYNSKLRPPPLWIDEDGVEIADQPKVVYSDPHYYPYTAQRPPPFVPPAVVFENSTRAASREQAESSQDGRDARDPPSACNPCQQPVQGTAPDST
jgi:hypothetical protein